MTNECFCSFPSLLMNKTNLRYFFSVDQERATEIEKNNLNLFNKMRAIIRTKHTTWRNKMQNPTQANLAPRERLGSAVSDQMQRTSRSKKRSGSARSERSATLSARGGSATKRIKTSNMRERPIHQRSISSLKSESKRRKDKEIMKENWK